ncbi:disease resistance protein RGA2-like [Chenopodium quinoa]|uniref:Uncharacterized protein n=1 Tax=Chenopodium quinoa TaxID=63459 RepID=A0A803LYW3_CHEQI|nr:disease resistance protein RGA2-like [Chenopodium quinoa]
MDIGTAMSVAQTLLAALQCSELNEICSIAGYKSKLGELRATVVRIKAVLEDAEDAEAKQVLSKQVQLYIEELKDAVYEADDLFDEFVTLAERKQLTEGIKVRVLSLFTKFGTAYNMTQRVKKIKSKLDAIAHDTRFSLSIDPKPIKDRRLETCSYVYEADIIGREADLEKIVSMLLDPNVQQNVSFLSIVGIGGLGKTALAQLVYNDARVTIDTAFQLRLWTCVADENENLDIKGVLCKILAPATGPMMNEGYTMDQLQIQLQQKLAGKKFLLVLDDVWTENPNSWYTLTQFLMGGQRGSWIVVTTRSRETARIVGAGPTHELQGLSREDSWCLFRRVAFRSQHSSSSEDLVEIGQDIVKECANVPLAIRVVGSLLYGQNKQKWLSIQKLGLAKACQSDIMPILKLSYYQLESPLKSCFCYCAVFPKDYVMKKETLIRLWMAHGYIPLDDPQSPEDLAEEYFSILLRRCFLQDVKKDGDGSIWSCKMHDLMHDLAQQVVGKEICRVETMNGDVDKKVRHLSLIRPTNNFSFTNKKSHLRSFLHTNESYCDQLCVAALVGNCKYIRALDLRESRIKSLPGSIGDLIHLRYLDLSWISGLEVLPGSITKLYNLQTLNLSCCEKLKELPKDLSKLVKLRVLDLLGCNELRYMPRGMRKLSCLHTLNTFVLGDMSSSKNNLLEGLEDLKALSNLKGSLDIKVRYMKTGYKINGGKEGGCLVNKEHLKEVDIDFGWNERREYEEAVMEELQPHSNLKIFGMVGYQGVRMPSWARDNYNLATFLPNLVQLEFYYCQQLQHLGQLRLPQLKILTLFGCPNLTAILECPALEMLELMSFNERLKIIPISREEASPYEIGPNLREVRIDNVAWLNSLPMNSFHDGAMLIIYADKKVESLGEAMEVFRSCSASLKYLEISNCDNLKSVVSGGLEHLSALEELTIGSCDNLNESEEVERVSFCQSLRTLELHDLDRIVKVPNWIQYLSSLQTLTIINFKKVESMPNWISQLTSLRELEVSNCSTRLKERCQEPSGEDWPHIQHIPSIEFA